MKWIRVLCVSFAVLSVFCKSVTPTSFSPDAKGKKSGSYKKFVPTAEWQRVEKGQPLPAGLHYRLNINTGETEAKLLESKEPTKPEHSSTGLVALPSEEGTGNSDDTLYMSKDELKKVLAEITADDPEPGDSHSQDGQTVKENYRSYEELKKEFGSLNISVKTDMEILNELVGKAKQFSNSDYDEEFVSTLKDIEYLVHQIDNAREFVRLGGLTHVVVPALNSTFPQVRAESLWLLGSAAQSNPKVQIAVLNAGIMPKLVKAIILDPDASVHARAIYALSCLTRQFPAAQAKFVEEGGLESLKGIFDIKRSYDFKTKIRVITLLNDILLERTFVRSAVEENDQVKSPEESESVQKIHQHKTGELKEKLRQYNAINLEKRLVEDGWCLRLSEFLWKLSESGMNSGRTQRRDDLGSIISKDVPYRPEHDAVEKVIGTLLVMKDLCLEEFQSDPKLVTVLHNFLSWYQDLSIREEVLQKQPSKVECNESENCHNTEDFSNGGDDSDMYYTGITETLKQLLKFLEKADLNNNYKKDEL